jgi:hypothetical protein
MDDTVRESNTGDRRQAIDTTIGAALDPLLRPIAKERRASAKRRIVELIDGVIEAQREPKQ